MAPFRHYTSNIERRRSERGRAAYRWQRRDRRPPYQRGQPREATLTAPPVPVFALTEAEFSDLHERLYGDKVIFAFEGETSSAKASEWTRAFNKKSSIQIEIHDRLANSLYAIRVLGPEAAAGVEKLLESSPITSVKERYAAVNRYTAYFSPKEPRDFKQLVTFIIRVASEYIYQLVDRIFADIGSIARRHIGPGIHNHCITLLVETTLKRFPSCAAFSLPGGRTQIVHFDFLDRDLRCPVCFSFRHKEATCYYRPVATFLEATPEESIPPGSAQKSQNTAEGPAEGLLIGNAIDYRHVSRDESNEEDRCYVYCH